MRYWRLRMKAYDRDHTAQGIALGQVGLWYGAWSAEDFYKARQGNSARQELAEVNERVLRWPAPGLTVASYETAVRFSEISQEDWVVLYCDEALHLLHLEAGMRSSPDHQLNVPEGKPEKELFKFRVVTERRTFRLDRLPDSYRLVPAVGRANVHTFLSTQRLMEVLGQAKDEDDAVRMFQEMPGSEWLELLGAASWESVCLGYLMQKEELMPRV